MVIKTLRQKIDAAAELMKYDAKNVIVAFDAQSRGIVDIWIYIYDEIALEETKHFKLSKLFTEKQNQEEYNKALEVLTNLHKAL